MANIKINVNGCDHQLDVDESTPLIYVLRNDLGLKGTKLGCGLEQCGACKVIVDGKAVFSCNSLDTIITEGLEHHYAITYSDVYKPLKVLARQLKLPVLELT